MPTVPVTPVHPGGRFPVRGRMLAAVLAASTAPLVVGAFGTRPGWVAVNARGCPVGLAEGPAFVAAGLAGIAVAAPATLPTLVALEAPVVAAGRIDDLRGARADRGVRGHLAALRAGRATSGQLKAFVLVAAGLAVAGLPSAAAGHLRRGRLGQRAPASPVPVQRGVVDTLVAGGVIAASANFVNLLDVVPGRALKAVLAASTAGALAAPATDVPTGVVLAAAAGAAAGLLPADLAEATMLGDAGSNAAGALVGWGLARSGRRLHRVALLGALSAATALSEAVSFSRSIEAVPMLRWLDRLGRRP
ncbi:MAG: hypothetical protein ACXVHC_05165 [Frankiaceae bacterium]